MRLLILFPVHLRDRIARISAQCLKRITKELAGRGIDSEVLVVGAEDWATALADEMGWHFLKYKNQPLGEKFNAGARWLVDRYPDSDYFLEWGQDNITRSDFSQMIEETMIAGAIWCITTNQFYMINEETGEVRKFHKGHGSNIGRMTRMDVMLAIRKTAGGEIYDPTIKIGLDRSLRMKVQAVTGRTIRIRDISSPYLIDVKGKGNLNKWANFAARPEAYPLAEIDGDFPELQQIAQLWQPQEKSDPTRSTSTSPQTAGTRSQATRTPLMTPSKLSPPPPPELSQGSSKLSTRPRKTTTARGRSSSARSRGR